MKLNFFKYQGTGNDFVILDNRHHEYDNISNKQVKLLCDRRFGIGADGLMLLNNADGYDFEMKYYNSDGNESSMCGNGGRCLVKFAFHRGITRTIYNFIAVDGEHEAEIDMDGIVCLKMKDVKSVHEINNDYLLDTGSPHYVKLVSDVMAYDVFTRGKEIRYSNKFSKDGVNVNFVEQRNDDEIMVRTYERGVENETLSCGTGVTASALVSFHNEIGFNEVIVITKGGKLSVEYDRHKDGSYSDIWLCGPAQLVFEGVIEIK